MTHYEVLGIESTATADEIKAAYRKCAKNAHPDREGGSDEAMQQINKAYEVLSDPERRSRYDASGDDSGESIEERAAASLAGLFAQCVQTDPFLMPKGPLAKARTEIRDAKRKAQDQIDAGQLLLGRLNKLEGRVRTKGKVNLFQRVLDNSRQQVQEVLAKNQSQLKVFDAMIVMLDDYEIVAGEQQSSTTPRIDLLAATPR